MRKACLLFLFVTQCAAADDIPVSARKYLGGLLTGDYGIVTEQDLASEASVGNPRPFDPKESSHGYFRWQCFPVKAVKLKVRTWRADDSMGPSNVIVTMCDLETWVEHDGKLEIYIGRRAKEVSYCREYMANWKRLTRGEKMVCLSGDYGGIYPPERRDTPLPYQLWTWDQIKSKKGCYSYFDGRCDHLSPAR